MTPPEHTTPAPLGPTLGEISRWHEHLRQLHARLRPHFARPEAHQHALRYLQAVLSDIPRKNGWQIAEQARQARPYGIQRLLSAAVWDPDAVRFATKPELGQRMIERTTSAGLPIRWVVADTVYGHSPELRLFLEKQGYAYALAVPSTEVVCVQTRTGLLLSDVASIAQQA